MRLAAAAPMLLLAGCGPGGDAEVNSAQLNRIAFQRNAIEEARPTARLQPLGAFAPPADYQGTVCRFTSNGGTLVVAFGSAAVARIDGTLRSFRAQAQVGPTGGFYRDNELALSIGAEPGAPARARVTNRLTEAQEEMEGAWQCR